MRKVTRKIIGTTLMIAAVVGYLYLYMNPPYSDEYPRVIEVWRGRNFVGALAVFAIGYLISGLRWRFFTVPKGKKWPFGTLSDLDKGKIHLASDYYLTPRWRRLATWLYAILALILLYILFVSVRDYF